MGTIQTDKVNTYKTLGNLNDKSGEGKAYGDRGIAHKSLRDFQSVIDDQEYCWKITYEILEDLRKEYCNRGNAHPSLRDFKTAVDYYERDLKIAKELGDRSGEGNAYGNLGNAYHSLGDFKKAVDYYERDLETAKVLGDR